MSLANEPEKQRAASNDILPQTFSSPTQKEEEKEAEELEQELVLRVDENDVNRNPNRSRLEGGQWAGYDGQGTKESPYIVDWDEIDPEDPYQWPRMRRWVITCQLTIWLLCVSFGSSIYTGALSQAKTQLHMTMPVAILPLSVYLLGLALGPLIWAPLSEIYGRRPIFLISCLLFVLFQIPCALAPNSMVLVVFRFLAGAFGSSPLSVGGGALADIWPSNERGIPNVLYSNGPWLSPILGPLIGGFLVESKLGWRWAFWLLLWSAAIPYVFGICFMPETYAPVLLQRRAQHLHSQSGLSVYYVSKYDVGRNETVIQSFLWNMLRPFIFFFTEPIVTLLSIYMALVYGSLYAAFIIFPLVFQSNPIVPQNRGWTAGIGGLAFLGTGLGLLLGNLMAPWWNRLYHRMAKKAPGGKAAPEARLPQGMLGAILMPIGLFLFAWTCSPPSIPYIIPILSCVPFGMGILLIFACIVAYLMDTYQTFTASALAATVVLRSILGAIFPLFVDGLLKEIGIRWGASVFAFMALACAPLPFVIYIFGRKIRMNSKVARQFEIARIPEQERHP